MIGEKSTASRAATSPPPLRTLPGQRPREQSNRTSHPGAPFTQPNHVRTPRGSRMYNGERPMGAAKGQQTKTMALYPPPPKCIASPSSGCAPAPAMAGHRGACSALRGSYIWASSRTSAAPEHYAHGHHTSDPPLALLSAHHPCLTPPTPRHLTRPKHVRAHRGSE